MRKIFLKSEIEAAQRISKNQIEVATHLGVTYATYRKWAKRYGIFEPFDQKLKARRAAIKEKVAQIKAELLGEDSDNPEDLSTKITDHLPKKNAYYISVKEWIEYGSKPKWVTKRMFSKRVLKSNIFPNACCLCGHDKQRKVDQKYPLLVDYVDGNEYNCKMENLRLVCYNCAFDLNIFSPVRKNSKRYIRNVIKNLIEEEEKQYGVEDDK